MRYPPRPALHMLLLAVLFVAAGAPRVWAQAEPATLNGYVTDAADGQPLELASVVLRDLGGALVRGSATDGDGRYVLSRVPAGRYVFEVTFIGFDAYVDTLALAAGEVRTVNVALGIGGDALGEVVVQAERSGAATVTAGQQTVRPADIELIPTPGVSADLASYLTALPGVVATGDRGGQLFIRGGEPSQNLVLLDGMLLYQPFHVLGFYSAFPADLLARTDVYAGGFPARFGNRISSVIDVWTRNGNNRRFSGAASLSPFIASARVEGPIVPGRVSFLTSARRSTVEQGAQQLVDARLPFDFGDAFAKIHAEISPKSRLSISGLTTFDRGTLREEGGGVSPEEVRWTNRALGGRYLLLPEIVPVALDVSLSASRFRTELGAEGAPDRTSEVASTYAALDAAFTGDRVDVDAGVSIRFVTLESALGGAFQNLELRRTTMDHYGLYVEPEFFVARGLRVRTGARLQFYRYRIDPYLEPRLRAVWERGIHQVSAAVGLYHQEEVGLSDRRDAASVFVAWADVLPEKDESGDVRAGELPGAWHAILGYRATPAPWLELSVEGYRKWITQLFVSEWTAFPRFTSRLQPADGRAYGFDVRAEVRRPPFYGYVGYGYSNTFYRARQASLELWYGEETLGFRPPHDRRHQLETLGAMSLGRFDLNVRWAFGSGLPFSRALGFDGFALVDDVRSAFNMPSTRRVIYERPYNGVLPTYHRLDVTVERTFSLPGGAELTAQATALNVYDRRNLFYLDVFTLRRVDQLPFIPSLGVQVAF